MNLSLKTFLRMRIAIFVARLSVMFIVESEDNSTDQLYTPVSSYQGIDQFSQSQGLPGWSKSKRRLVTTRWFVNSGLQTTSHQKLVTPNNSPILAAGSTPLSLKYELGRQAFWHLCKHTVGMMTLKVCVVGSGASDEDEGTPSQTIAVPHRLATPLQLGLARIPDDRSSCKSLKLCALYLLFR